MNTVRKSQLVLSLGLLSLVGAGAARAAAPIGDGQEQAREMILGRAGAKILPAVDLPGDRRIQVDALELARRMILGTQAGTNSINARLARRAE
jgi:hypothetical protein